MSRHPPLPGYDGFMNPDEWIVRDPSICGGEPVFRGTRVTLRTVLASLADGDSVEQTLEVFLASANNR